ncbi:ImmA/IrrE family metallo-endopeptidase (plasmid) [Bacillus thuringiensis LM1212]|uniref:ArdC-like ssDNA-binding domain-containing protein n=1 Tax=Bacillus cereus group TaxID=86661 RepID=UPI0003F56E50|nr:MULTISPECIES: ArdC-like ssDNA-binding domain-containing protein [Bacillus cereus group]AXY11416.1 ImmA/IrrE family metallo-endopeptidase [Bacillus thuringiensis LM1212]QDF27291.1 ImmA/IrrE family metallo-endopeptidase [Bacillus tropicus]QUG99192.1 ImmA/IrrE family metallo-endopeptidase [Bacillus tropicus]
MSKKRSPVSFEEKKQKVEALTKKMEKSIEGYFRSPGDLKEYLSFMAKFYRYSPSNIVLIQSQFEGSKAVGSFSFWKEKGFSVNKGEKGIQILVPNRTTAKFKDKTGTWKPVAKASEEEKKQIESKNVEVKPGRLYFSVGYVFDVSQTNAKAEDLPRIFPNRWLEGSVGDYKSLYKGMEAIAEKNGVKIIEPKQELGVAKGVSYTLTKEVALNPRNSELQNVKTLLHELAHAKLHTAETHMNYSAPEKEFQAEMTAYTVSSYFGIDTSEYSLGYLANWTQGKELKDKSKLLKEVHETSTEFIETIENTLEKVKEQIPEKEVGSMANIKDMDYESLKGTPAHLVTIEVLDKDIQDEEVARIHMMDAVTKEINYLSVWNPDKSDREDLYVSLIEKNGNRENVYLDNILKPNVYEKVQNSIFDGKGNQSFLLHEKDAKMSLDEIVKDERYGILVDKAEEQKNPAFSEKEVELYKEMKKEGYASIDSLEQKLNPLPHTATHVTASMEKELGGKYEAFKRAQSHETVNDIDSIIHRVQMEERYFATKHVAIDNELITQESVTQLEHKVQEKLNKEGVTATKQTESKVVDREKQFEPFSNFAQFQNVAKKKKEEVELER